MLIHVIETNHGEVIEHDLGKTRNPSRFARDLRGNLTNIAHKDPNNKTPQEIHENLLLNHNEQKSLENLPENHRKRKTFEGTRLKTRLIFGSFYEVRLQRHS